MRVTERLSGELEPLTLDGVDIVPLPCSDVGEGQSAVTLKPQPLDPSRLETLIGYEQATFNAAGEFILQDVTIAELCQR